MMGLGGIFGVPQMSPPPEQSFADRLDAAVNADDQEAIRQLQAEMQANPELAQSKHPGLPQFTFQEFLQMATEPAREPQDVAIDKMRVPGKASGVDQRVPGYGYGGQPLENGDDIGSASNLSPGLTPQQMGYEAPPQPSRYPGEGRQVPGKPAPKAMEDIHVRLPGEPAPPGGGPSATIVDLDTGETIGMIDLDVLTENNRAAFQRAYEASKPSIRQEDQAAREMAAQYALATGLPLETAWKLYSDMSEPQLQRESNERNARAMSMQRQQGSGFGQNLALRKFGQQQFDKFFSANEIKSDWNAIKTLQNSFGTLVASHEAGGWGVADHVAIKQIIAAMESGRLSDKDYQLIEGGIGSVWYDIKGWLEQRLSENITSEEFQRRGVEALQGLSPLKRKGFLESLRLIYQNKLQTFSDAYTKARGMVDTAGSQQEREQIIRNIRSTFDKAFWQGDPEINRGLSGSESGVGNQRSSASISTRGSATPASPEESATPASPEELDAELKGIGH